MHNNNQHGARGFSLVELMITVLIASILAVIVVPSYRDYVMRGKISEAYGALADFRTRMEQFYQDNRSYAGGGLGGCGVAAPSTGSLRYFALTCVVNAAGQYTVTATGLTGSGVDPFTFGIDQLNTKTTLAVPAGWALPAPNVCWVTRKGGQC
jgi:type IV pilus assembly protein PilE